jgi:hypothetical protein
VGSFFFLHGKILLSVVPSPASCFRLALFDELLLFVVFLEFGFALMLSRGGTTQSFTALLLLLMLLMLMLLLLLLLAPMALELWWLRLDESTLLSCCKKHNNKIITLDKLNVKQWQHAVQDLLISRSGYIVIIVGRCCYSICWWKSTAAAAATASANGVGIMVATAR